MTRPTDQQTADKDEKMSTKRAKRVATIAARATSIADGGWWLAFFYQEALSGYAIGELVFMGKNEFPNKEEAQEAARQWEAQA